MKKKKKKKKKSLAYLFRKTNVYEHNFSNYIVFVCSFYFLDNSKNNKKKEKKKAVISTN